MYKIKDLQQSGTFEDDIFDTKESCRQALVDYHSVDWTAEQDIESQTLDELCEHGDWEILDLNQQDEND